MIHKLYLWLMKLGSDSGCHQMVERSFSFRGHQFPVCARCTGVLLGNILAYALILVYMPPSQVCLIGCTVMFIDWWVQELNIRQSTNTRRLVTGIIGGYSLTTLCCIVIKILFRF